mgnify:CR=1 FL=1
MSDVQPEPKSSAQEPPAADGPVEEVDGNPPSKPVNHVDEKGRRANDPSLSRTAGVPESPQVSRGRPDGEVAP